ncbi:DUF2786 domain-containing protein (plasmid) [Lichenicola cladoniae]|uniref:DUF2786 domain-containing protein n=1 Tax=Lichenicola cladoniae TaxID=1484109 RepID=A0A6M8HXQ5_9PROT|nr:DUF2786 domain-containing protein [Lichenicola cladoniae]QKE92975.1 DUF2786 domain-containing protein [Lichenicola cladoniae]
MSQDTELVRVKARIKALTEWTIARGCTEAEAMAAADMVGRLLERYALSMEEIDIRDEPCIRIEVPLRGIRRRPIDACVPAIAAFCDCKVWLSRDRSPPSYVFFGFATDTALAAYLYAVIERAIHSDSQTFRSARPALAGTALSRATSSFQLGMAARIAERLVDMHDDREASVATQRPTGSALTIVRHQVVEAAFRASGPRLRAMPGLTLHNDTAFRVGRLAGERVNLRRPVEQDDQNRLA